MRFILALLYPLSLFHYIVYLFLPKEIKQDIDEDVVYMNQRRKCHDSLIKYLVYHKPYRNLFYYRIRRKKIIRLILSLFLPAQEFFSINENCEIAGGIYVLNHPWCSRIGARKVGKHFTIRQNTTLGMSKLDRQDLMPTIGDDVEVGAHSIIIGDIHIGNNVVIAAGSVVIHDVPDNCMVAGNPAVIKKRI